MFLLLERRGLVQVSKLLEKKKNYRCSRRENTFFVLLDGIFKVYFRETFPWIDIEQVSIIIFSWHH